MIDGHARVATWRSPPGHRGGAPPGQAANRAGGGAAGSCARPPIGGRTQPSRRTVSMLPRAKSGDAVSTSTGTSRLRRRRRRASRQPLTSSRCIPRVEAGRVTETGEVHPRRNQRVLRGVVRLRVVAEDRACGPSTRSIRGATRIAKASRSPAAARMTSETSSLWGAAATLSSTSDTFVAHHLDGPATAGVHPICGCGGRLLASGPEIFQ